MGTFIARQQIVVNAPREKVWEALTNPDLVAQWLFGTRVESDWKLGSPILWRGEYQGRSYEDKGKVLEIEQGKKLVTTYWSSLSGQPDRPEHYKTVRYELSDVEGGTKLTVTQDNNRNREETRHSEDNWRTAFKQMKAALEGGEAATR